MHPLVKLARQTIEEFTRDRKAPRETTLPEDLPEEFMRERAGVFVSLKKHGELRGCIGTFLPITESIAQEVARNAVAAASEDPRFPPVSEDEMPDITCSVDVLSTPEPVADLSELDPGRYGIIVRSGFRRGLLLPDLEGVDTVERQLQIAMMKAGIAPSEKDLEIERFEVMRYR